MYILHLYAFPNAKYSFERTELGPLIPQKKASI